MHWSHRYFKYCKCCTILQTFVHVLPVKLSCFLHNFPCVLVTIQFLPVEFQFLMVSNHHLWWFFTPYQPHIPVLPFKIQILPGEHPVFPSDFVEILYENRIILPLSSCTSLASPPSSPCAVHLGVGVGRRYASPVLLPRLTPQKKIAVWMLLFLRNWGVLPNPGITLHRQGMNKGWTDLVIFRG